MPESIKCAFLFLTLLIATACSGEEPQRYEFGTSTAGGPTGWPVWVEELTFDNSWGVPVGSLRGGFDRTPPGGASAAGFGPKPAPSTISAKWFSHRTQMFYEIELTLPADLDDRLRKWYREYPPDKFMHTLITGFSGKGEALVWWEAYCRLCGRDRSQDFSTPIIASAQADTATMTLGYYRTQTDNFIDEGLFPSPFPVEDIMPPLDPWGTGVGTTPADSWVEG